MSEKSKRTKLFRVALGLVCVAALASLLIGQAQTRPNPQELNNLSGPPSGKLQDLASRKAEVSQLDLLILKTQIDNVTNRWPTSTVGLPSYGYDVRQSKIFANVFTNENWFRTNAAEKVSQELRTSGMLYCASFASSELLEEPMKKGQLNCEVYFFTYGGSPTDTTGRRVLAKFDYSTLQVTLN